MATDAEIGKHLSMSARNVQKLRAEGVLPAPACSLDANRDAYIAHMREMAAGRVKAPEANSLDVERTRVAKAQAEELERRNAQARGELLPAMLVHSAVIGMIEVTKAKLKRVGAKVSRGDAALRSRVNQAIEDALLDLSATGANVVLEGLRRA